MQAQVLNSLKDLDLWAVQAKIGDEADFTIPGELSQEEASKFAGDLNANADNHVWISVGEMGCVPDPVTKIHVRCSA
jgi:hypothetical protein